MLKVRWFCLWFSVISTTSCGLLQKSNLTNLGSMDDVMISCVGKIANEFFTRKENVLIIYGQSFIAGEMLRRIGSHFGINLANENSGIDFGAIWDYIVLDDKSTRDPYEAVENMIVNRRGRYVIVTRSDQETLETSAVRFLESGTLDVIFLRASNDGTVKVFGYEMSSQYTNWTRLCVLDIWNGKFENGTNLFASKLENMNKYPLKVTVMNVKRIGIDTHITRENGEIKISGVGSNLLNAFAEKLNFRILVRENSYFGDKEKDGKWTGIPGQLIRGDADLSFAAIIPTPDVTQDLEYSEFYRWESAHFIMKIRGKTVSWKSIFKPFSSDMWISELVVLLTTMGLVCVAKKLWSMNILKEYIKYIDILRVLFYQSVGYPKLSGFRLAFALWLMYCYLTNVLYTSSLVKKLSTPIYRKNPNTFEELEKTDLELGGLLSMGVLLGETGDPVQRKIHDRYVYLKYQNFWELMTEKDRAIVLYRTTSILHNWKYRLDDSMWVHAVEEPIITFPLFYYMRKGHPIREPLSNFIRKIHSSGLIVKWMADHNPVKAEKKNGQESVVLTIEHLAGVFLVLFCGYLISTVRFFYELYVYRG